MLRRLVIALALAPVGCVSVSPAPEAVDSLAFELAGTIRRGATVDATTFTGAQVTSRSFNLSRQSHDAWVGGFSFNGLARELPLNLSVGPDAIRGIGFLLVRSSPGPGRTVYEGVFDGKKFRFEVSAEELQVKTARLASSYAGPVREGDRLILHSDSELVLTGDAMAMADPPWPHLALALVATFVTAASDMRGL